jgi:hypothetical protein
VRLFDQIRGFARFWSDDPIFKGGARYSFRLFVPLCAAVAIAAALLGSWSVAAIFGIATLFAVDWLYRDYRDRSAGGREN